MPVKFNATIENTLHTWAEAATGITFIWDREDVERPALPYGMLSYLTGPTTDQEPSLDYKELDTFTRKTAKVFTLTINIYGNGSYFSYIDNLKDSLYQEDVKATFRKNANLVFIDFDQTNDLSQLLDTDFEQRASFDVTFSFNSEKDETIREIQRVFGSVGDITFDTDNI